MGDIYNGARCKSYCWSQSHSDLEIRVNLAKMISYEDVSVEITSDSIRVELDNDDFDSTDSNSTGSSSVKTLIMSKFEHPVDTESVSWMIDKDGPCIVIYIDKAENLWWRKLLVDEQATKEGPKNYTVLMEHLDDGSRMAIDRIVVEQRNKALRKNDDLSPA